MNSPRRYKDTSVHSRFTPNKALRALTESRQQGTPASSGKAGKTRNFSPRKEPAILHLNTIKARLAERKPSPTKTRDSKARTGSVPGSSAITHGSSVRTLWLKSTLELTRKPSPPKKVSVWRPEEETVKVPARAKSVMRPQKKVEPWKEPVILKQSPIMAKTMELPTRKKSPQRKAETPTKKTGRVQVEERTKSETKKRTRSPRKERRSRQASPERAPSSEGRVKNRNSASRKVTAWRPEKEDSPKRERTRSPRKAAAKEAKNAMVTPNKNEEVVTQKQNEEVVTQEQYEEVAPEKNNEEVTQKQNQEVTPKKREEVVTQEKNEEVTRKKKEEATPKKKEVVTRENKEEVTQKEKEEAPKKQRFSVTLTQNIERIDSNENKEKKDNEEKKTVLQLSHDFDTLVDQPQEEKRLRLSVELTQNFEEPSPSEPESDVEKDECNLSIHLTHDFEESPAKEPQQNDIQTQPNDLPILLHHVKRLPSVEGEEIQLPDDETEQEKETQPPNPPLELSKIETKTIPSPPETPKKTSPKQGTGIPRRQRNPSPEKTASPRTNPTKQDQKMKSQTPQKRKSKLPVKRQRSLSVEAVEKKKRPVETPVVKEQPQPQEERKHISFVLPPEGEEEYWSLPSRDPVFDTQLEQLLQSVDKDQSLRKSLGDFTPPTDLSRKCRFPRGFLEDIVHGLLEEEEEEEFVRTATPESFKSKGSDTNSEDTDDFLELENEMTEEQEELVDNFDIVGVCIAKKVRDAQQRSQMMALMKDNKGCHFVLLLREPDHLIAGLYLLDLDANNAMCIWGNTKEELDGSEDLKYWTYQVTTDTFIPQEDLGFTPLTDAVSMNL